MPVTAGAPNPRAPLQPARASQHNVPLAAARGTTIRLAAHMGYVRERGNWLYSANIWEFDTVINSPRIRIMSDKQELIAKLLEMQKKFIDYEHENGVEMEDYFAAEEVTVH